MEEVQIGDMQDRGAVRVVDRRWTRAGSLA
jgi:hypothetical protein